jgi:diguanylate cyclase (GGDEF)-like protein
VDVFFKGLLARLWREADSLALIELSRQEIHWLISPRKHLSLLSRRRITMIVSRVRLFSGLFALLTPMWIILDVLVFPREVWLGLVWARLIATLAFFGNLVLPRRMEASRDAYSALGVLLAIPTCFFVYSYQHMEQFHLDGLQAAFAAGYAFLPFVMVAGLSVFPLTLIENLFFTIPMLLAQIVAAVMHLPVLNWPTVAASFWLLVLIMGVASMAGVSQLAFMIVLVRESIRDGLTGCYSRHSGEELLELQFNIALRNGSPLAVAFIDLDHFKRVNDTFGHDSGDRVLRNAVDSIRSQVRNSDILTRWGGEEFILIMPNTTTEAACVALRRLRAKGFGSMPDAANVTASIGMAERVRDGREAWQDLVATADGRMYQAKQSGRDRIVGCPQQADKPVPGAIP